MPGKQKQQATNRYSCPINKIVVEPNLFSWACSSVG